MPFPPLEAVFRFIYAFSECGGPVVNKMVAEGQFPAMMSSIQQVTPVDLTDLSHILSPVHDPLYFRQM